VIQALEELDKLLEINPEIAFAYAFKGRCSFYLGKYNEAFNWFRIALQKNPKTIWELNMCCNLGIKCGIPFQEILDSILTPNLKYYIQTASNLLNSLKQYEERENNTNRPSTPETTRINYIDDNDNNSNNYKVSEDDPKGVMTLFLELSELCQNDSSSSKNKKHTPRKGTTL
jgi:hypothetical protein